VHATTTHQLSVVGERKPELQERAGGQHDEHKAHHAFDAAEIGDDHGAHQRADTDCGRQRREPFGALMEVAIGITRQQFAEGAQKNVRDHHEDDEQA
jgi:hypothetical protein